jgi:hypothetical protein
MADEQAWAEKRIRVIEVHFDGQAYSLRGEQYEQWRKAEDLSDEDEAAEKVRLLRVWGLRK